MFLDSKIAFKMELGKNKHKYVVNYGIAPFFADGLKQQVSESEWFAVCADESLNKIIQESEMDLILRFWDTCKNQVQVRYWDSIFLGHAIAANLLKKINDSEVFLFFFGAALQGGRKYSQFGQSQNA